MTDKSPFGTLREITNIYEAEYQPYDMEGPLLENMSYIPLTYNRDGNALGCYVIRMGPGTETVFHTHQQNEDYLILEGELIEPDGRVLRKGDFVHYEEGTQHNSRTETGCLAIGFDWRNAES